MTLFKKSFVCYCRVASAVSGGNSGEAEGGATAPPPSINRHSLSEAFGSVGIFKTIEYTETDGKNYWRVRQLISTERRFHYLGTICLICCVNHFSHFCACSYLLKKPKKL